MSNGFNSDANAPRVRSRCTGPHRRSKSVGGKRWMNAIETSADWAASSSVFQCAPATCSDWLEHGEWEDKVYARDGGERMREVEQRHLAVETRAGQSGGAGPLAP